jgi:pimeloyl-ACP methyl ester carboxylesterase
LGVRHFSVHGLQQDTWPEPEFVVTVAEQVLVKTGWVQTEGDKLYYEDRGRGRPLLMISGGGGDAGFYGAVASMLADEFRVITYDRRANSRSTRNEPQNFEVSQQARDALAVLHAVGEQSALIFGNSGGAVIALEIAKIRPQAVQLAIVHEAPTVRLLPDAHKWTRFFAACYATAFRFGPHVAMLRFALSTGIPRSALRAVPHDVAQRLSGNFDFFVKHEMVAFTNYKPDFDKLRSASIVASAGKWTLERKLFYGRTALVLADQVGCDMIPLPGNHLSYLDRPREWADELRVILRRAS